MTGQKSRGGYPAAYRNGASGAANDNGFQSGGRPSRGSASTGPTPRGVPRGFPANDNLPSRGWRGGLSDLGNRISRNAGRANALIQIGRFLATYYLPGTYTGLSGHSDYLDGSWSIKRMCTGGPPTNYQQFIADVSITSCGPDSLVGTRVLGVDPIYTSTRSILLLEPTPEGPYQARVSTWQHRAVQGPAYWVQRQYAPVPRVEPDVVPWAPSVDPMVQPVKQPVEDPHPIPYRVLPYRRPHPWRVEQSEWGPAPAAVVREDPGVVLDSVAPPAAAPPHETKPPPPGTKEKKVKLSLFWRGAKKAMSEITEYGDAMDDIYNAIPESVRGKRKRGRKKRWAYVYAHVNDVDWGDAVWNILKDQAEDMFYGRSAKAGQKAGHYATGNPGRQLQPSRFPSYAEKWAYYEKKYPNHK